VTAPRPVTLSSVQTDARAFFGDDARVTLTRIGNAPVYAVVGSDGAPIVRGQVIAAGTTLEELARAMRAAVC
jgi:hypothetical protein